VTGDHAGQEYKMRFELDITSSRLAIVGLSPLGLTLFTIVQEKGGISVEIPAKGQTVFDPRHMLFDLYLTYWPSKALQPALSRIRMRLDQTAEGTVRRIRGLDGNLIAEIKYLAKHMKTGEIIIQHFDFPYRLRIKTLETRSAR
jgi:phospho-N-acetylmuramoyl-pentapeptide-transferase